MHEHTLPPTRVSQRSRFVRTYLVPLAVLMVVVIAGYVAWHYKLFGLFSAARHDTGSTEVTQTLSFSEARARAEQKAYAWRADAVPAEARPHTDGSWRFVFTSVTRGAVSYVVDVRGDTVTGVESDTYPSAGASFPANMKSPEDAIAEMQQLPGRANLKAVSVEAIYNHTDGVWYWGVHTEQGTVSIAMQR